MESASDSQASERDQNGPPATGSDQASSQYLTLLDSFHSEVWASIRHKEGNIWQYLSFYTGTVGLIVAVGLQFVQLWVAVLAVLLLTFWGQLIVLDAGWWFSRNLVIITNLQRQLYGRQLGYLLPIRYAKGTSTSDFLHIIHFAFMATINIAAFTALALSMVGASALSSGKNVAQFCLVVLVYLAGFYIVHWLEDRNRRKAFEFRRENPGTAILLPDGRRTEDRSLTVPVPVQIVADHSRSPRPFVAPFALAWTAALIQIIALINLKLPATVLTIPSAVLLAEIALLLSRFYASKRLAKVVARYEESEGDWTESSSAAEAERRGYKRLVWVLRVLLVISLGAAAVLLTLAARQQGASFVHLIVRSAAVVFAV